MVRVGFIEPLRDRKVVEVLDVCPFRLFWIIVVHALFIIFNKSLVTGVFPEDMKLAIVKPLYKAKSKFEICNYRPISLTKFLKKHNVLYGGQYGFRKQRSTTDAILDLTGNILDGLIRKCIQ